MAVLLGMDSASVFYGAAALTAITDNAALPPTLVAILAFRLL